jgi:uncharacterized protein
MSAPDQPLLDANDPPALSAPVIPARRDPAWNVWDVAMIAFVFLLAMVVSTLIVMGVAGAYGGHLLDAQELARNPLIAVIVQLLAYLLTFGFARIYVSAKSGERFWTALCWNVPSLPTSAGLLLLGAALALSVQLTSSFLPMPKNLPVEQYFRSADSIWLMVAFGTLVAPLMEETFFRGLLFPALRRWAGEPESIIVTGILLCLLSVAPLAWVMVRYQQVSKLGIALVVVGLILIAGAASTRNRSRMNERWDTGVAVVITGILFALMHQGQLARAWAPLLMLFIVGVSLTVVRALTHSLAASWLVHVAYNAALFVMLFIGTGGFTNLQPLAR